jgi:hypothetical protein
MSNTTSLYSNTSSGNATVPANNNTSLYNTTGVPQTINNNISVTGNIFAAGYISAGGNVYGANLVTTGNVYAGNIIGNVVGNLVLSGGNTEVIFNNNDTACSSPAFTFNNSSNVMAVTGAITATGNITGNYILGNGSQLTGLPATYGNSNVTTLLSGFGSNTVSTTGNITAGYFLGDGSQLTNLPAGNYSNANVANFLPTYSGAITANTVSATGNVTGNYILGDGSQLTNLPIPGVYGNTQVASFLAAFGSNVVSTTGNVTAGYLLGNGSQLTGITANYSNANVVNLLAAFGSNSISTTGNVTAGYVAANGSLLTNITGGNVTGQVANALVAGTVTTAAQPNITSVGTVTSLTSSGNVTGNYIIGDGSQLTNLPVQPGTYSNSNVAAYLPIYTGDYAGGNMSLTGNVTASYLKTSGATGNIVGANYVSANFYLGDGGQLSNITSTYGNSNVTTLLAALGSNTISSTGNITTTANISGNYILGNGSQLTGLPAGYSNADVNSHLAAFGSNVISTTGNITAGYFAGNGSLLTAITGANVTGTVANATQANVANTANAVAGANVSGQVANALVAGTVYTNAQPNITSVGTLSSLSVSGNVTGGNIVSGTFQAVNSGGGTLKNSSGTTQAAWGAGGGDNFAINVSTNLNGNNAQIDISPTGTGHVHIKPTGTGAVEIAPTSAGTINNMIIGNATPAAATVTTLSTTGNIIASGILTDGYYYANGTPFTGGGGGTYGNANVNTLLAAWGSNTLSTTGTVNAGNITGGNILTAGLISATGNITAANLGNVSALNLNGNSSQVLYGNGVFATVAGGGGSPGGANTQLQFNDGGAFAGNTAMTFDVTSGNVTLGNIRFNNNVITNINSFQSNTNPNPGRILIGTGRNGNYSGTGGQFGSNGQAARLMVQDEIFKYDDGLRTVEVYGGLFANLSGGNIGTANSNSRITGVNGEVYVLSGNALGTVASAVRAGGFALNLGNSANTSNAFVNAGAAVTGFLGVAAGSSANTLILVNSSTTLNGAVANLLGYTFNSQGTANITGNVAGFYMANNSTQYGFTTANTARNVTNYHAFRNDDDLAQSRLGMLSRFHELNANTSTATGTVNIDKNSGQVQTIYPTGNVTVGTFSNFVTRVTKPDATFVNTADTVTLIIQQGATPYTITMPTGNTQIRYASGLTTVGATANTTTMISITGVYDYGTAANEYLVTISPEFS